METIYSTTDGSIIDTPISGGLLSADDGPITFDHLSMGGYVPGTSGVVPIYSTTGIPIYSTTGIPLHAAIVKEEEESDFSGYKVYGETEIEINWSSSGISDLDCCAYWSDNPTAKIGWSHGHGSLANDNYKAYWTDDDTGSGPEYIALLTTPARRSTKEFSPYQYKIHLNFYGYADSGIPTATIYVRFNDITLSASITPGINSGQAATPSDPSLTITFSADGTPLSIQ